jgi:hypothetical protein
LDEQEAIYEAKAVSPQTAPQVAAELTADALAAHVDVELRLGPDDLANLLQVAGRLLRRSPSGRRYSCSLFGLRPDTSASRHFRPRADRVALAGVHSARIGWSHVGRAVLRVVIGGTDEYRQAVPVLGCLPPALTIDEIPGFSYSRVTATG